jgi:hypothetical protein
MCCPINRIGTSYESASSQTLLEKLVSLFRASFEANPAMGLSGKIRHFYGLYFLVSDPATRTFVDSTEFPAKFQEVWTHDQLVFEEPKGWRGNMPMQSPLILLWLEIWNSLKTNYQRELSVLAHSPVRMRKQFPIH